MSGSYLEKVLGKLAHQLAAYDEASLMSLWETYAEKVRRFEPTKAWEESVLVFCLIQAVRMKNQLFNHHWALSRQAGEGRELDLTALTAPEPPRPEEIDPKTGRRIKPVEKKQGKLIELKLQESPACKGKPKEGDEE